MIKYYSNHIIVNYIKQILKSFNLPTFTIIKDGETIILIKDKTYLYKDTIYKAKSTEIVSNWSNKNVNKLTYIVDYVENANLLNLTKNFILRNNIYDEYTHEYLGDYLRFYRDYYGLNLMGMYNCLSGKIASNILVQDTNKTYIDSNDDTYKIYRVPVRFNKNYYIYVDSSVGFEVVAGFVKNGVQVRYIKNNNTGNNALDDFYPQTYQRFGSSRFNTAVEYSKLNLTSWDDTLNGVEKELCLFIKLPSTNNSSVVVLEDICITNDKWYDDKNIGHYQGIIANFAEDKMVYKTPSQLIKINDNYNHPFADRLIEYLSKNAITDLDEIPQNLKNAETGLIASGTIPNYTPYILWTDELRKRIYLKSIDKGILDNKYDVLGYIDKDVESKLVKYTFNSELEV